MNQEFANFVMDGVNRGDQLGFMFVYNTTRVAESGSKLDGKAG